MAISLNLVHKWDIHYSYRLQQVHARSMQLKILTTKASENYVAPTDNGNFLLCYLLIFQLPPLPFQMFV